MYTTAQLNNIMEELLAQESDDHVIYNESYLDCLLDHGLITEDQWRETHSAYVLHLDDL
jgi:hypothetical protein